MSPTPTTETFSTAPAIDRPFPFRPAGWVQPAGGWAQAGADPPLRPAPLGVGRRGVPQSLHTAGPTLPAWRVQPEVTGPASSRRGRGRGRPDSLAGGPAHLRQEHLGRQ